MEALLVAAGCGLFSFIGSWAAIKVRLDYMQRDIDHAHERLARLEELQFDRG